MTNRFSPGSQVFYLLIASSVLMLLLSSCLSGGTSLEIDVKRNTAELQLEYRIADDLLTFAENGGLDSQWSIPVDRSAFGKLSDVNPGISLVSYRKSYDEDAGLWTVSAGLAFAAISDLEKYFGMNSGFRYTGQGGEHLLELPLVMGLASVLNDDQLQILNDQDRPPLEFRFHVAVSGQLADFDLKGYAPEDMKTDGSDIDLVYRAGDLAAFDGPVLLAVHWSD